MRGTRIPFIVLVFLNAGFLGAQTKLLSLQELSNCTVYATDYRDTLKTSEAYQYADEVYALRYRHVPIGVKDWEHTTSDFPFTAADFPNLQFLIISASVDIPSNLAQFENLQVLFLEDGIESWDYPPGDVEEAIKEMKPVMFPEQFYELKHLKVLYSSVQRNIYDYGYGLPNSFFFFDITKLSAMTSLELVDLDDGFMDDKLTLAFFCPNLKVLVGSNKYNAVFGTVNGNLQFYHEKHPPQVEEFKTRSGNLLLVNEKLHISGNPASNEKIQHSESEVLKVYDQLLTEANEKQPLATVPEPNKLTIYESSKFDYSANLIIMEGNPPVLDSSPLVTNELFAKHTGFSDKKIGLLTTYYYYPKSNSYFIKTTFHNRWQEDIIQVKTCYPISNETVELKYYVLENSRKILEKGRKQEVITTSYIHFGEDWTRLEGRY